MQAGLERWRYDWLPVWVQAAFVLLAIVIGVLIAELPLVWVGILLLTAVLVTITLIDPLYGMAITLVFGPSKPLTDYFVPTLPLDLGQIALLVTLGAWFIHAVRRHVQRVPDSPFVLPLLGFIGVGALTMLNALSLGFALKELIKWGQLLIMMLLVIDLALPRRWQLVFGAVLLAATLEGLIGVWQFGLRGDGPEHFLILGDRFYRAYGTFEQPNPYAGFMGLTLPLSIGLTLAALGGWLGPVIDTWKGKLGWQRILGALLNDRFPRLVGFGMISGLLFAALIMSWSRGAWLGFGAAGIAILFAWPRKAWIGAGLVLVALITGVVLLEAGLLPDAIAERATGFSEFVQTFDVRGSNITPENYAVLERLAHWQAAESMAQYNFWLGVGIGNYEPVYPAYALMNWPYALGHAHNIYLNTLAEMGIIGLAAYLGMWSVILWQTWRVTRFQDIWIRCIAIGMLGTWVHLSVHSFLDKLYVANIHLHIGALLGVLSIFLANWQREKRSGDANN